LLHFCLHRPERALKNQVMAGLRFSNSNKVERNSGVWIDGQYVGYVKELKGKKILLLPRAHEISVREAGYKHFTRTIATGGIRAASV